jgi:hypothetical protein
VGEEKAGKTFLTCDFPAPGGITEAAVDAGRDAAWHATRTDAVASTIASLNGRRPE